MKARDDFDLEAIERRLAARADRAAPAGHRDRVLAAVQDTLAGRTAPRATPSGLEAGGTTALVVLALSAVLAVAAPWLVVTQAAGLTSPEPRLVAQARAAGIDFPVELVATTGPARETPSRAAMPNLLEHRHEAWRLRTLLTGEL
jgi:hypothetical protein